MALKPGRVTLPRSLSARILTGRACPPQASHLSYEAGAAPTSSDLPAVALEYTADRDVLRRVLHQVGQGMPCVSGARHVVTCAAVARASAARRARCVLCGEARICLHRCTCRKPLSRMRSGLAQTSHVAIHTVRLPSAPLQLLCVFSLSYAFACICHANMFTSLHHTTEAST